MFKPSSNFLNDRSKAVIFCGNILLFVFCVCLSSVWSVPCSLVVTYWEMAELLAVLYVMFFVFFTLFHMVSWVRCGI